MNKAKNHATNYIDRIYSKNPKSSGRKYIISAILGFGVFLICTLLLAFTGAMIIIKSTDPNALIPFVSTISMTVSAIIGSIVAVKKSDGNTVISTLLFLVTIVLAILIMSLIYMSDKSTQGTSVLQFLLLKIPVVLGAFFGGRIATIKRKPKSLYSKYK